MEDLIDHWDDQAAAVCEQGPKHIIVWRIDIRISHNFPFLINVVYVYYIPSLL